MIKYLVYLPIFFVTPVVSAISFEPIEEIKTYTLKIDAEKKLF